MELSAHVYINTASLIFIDHNTVSVAPDLDAKLDCLLYQASELEERVALASDTGQQQLMGWGGGATGTSAVLWKAH